MDLIDRRQAVKIVDEIDTFCCGWRDYAIGRIMELPPAEKRGKWVGISPMVDTMMCSECGENIISKEFATPYCPNCGAKMESEE